MKKRTGVSPVLIEIIVVTLFLALSSSVTLQLIAKASEISKTATANSRALLLAENLLERTKADPAGGAARTVSDRRTFSEDADGLTLSCAVEREETAAGVLYHIEVAAEGTDIRLETDRYVPDWEVGAS